MSDQFNTPSFPSDTVNGPVSASLDLPQQVRQPAGESGGYRAPGGGVRPSIRDRIAAVAPYSAQLVKIDEWGVEVEVRSLSLGERNEMLQKSAKEDGGAAEMSTLFPVICILCTYDPETGERVFAEDDAEFINSRPANLADKIAMVAMELSGMKEKAVDEAAKKSSETEASGPSS